jgi:hypothetical protein
MSNRGAGSIEKYVSVLILIIIILAGAGVYFKQFRYDKSRFEGEVSSQQPNQKPAAAEAAYFKELLPAGYKPGGKAEIFDPESLYIKIDGKAELYLESGFKRLDCRMMASESDPNSWIEFYAYDMGTGLNAFAVYSQQKRPDGVDVDICDFAYKTADAVFLCNGKFYCEIMSSGPSQKNMDAMLAAGAGFVKATGNQAGRIDELEIFPRANLEKGSHKFYLADAYGFEGFKNTFSAAYNIGESRVTAFVFKSKDQASAKALAQEYLKFVKDNAMGKEKAPVNPELDGALIDLGGVYEIVFAKGQFVAGVHEADDQKAAEQVAMELYKKLGEKTDGGK